MDQGAAQRHALLLPAGKLPRITIAVTGQTNAIEQLFGEPALLGDAAEIAHAGLQRDIGKHRAPLQQDGLLKYDAEVLDRPGDAFAFVDDVALRGYRQATDDFQQRSLAAAADADKGDEFTRRDLKVDVVERGDNLTASRGKSLPHACDREDRPLAGTGHWAAVTHLAGRSCQLAACDDS